MNRRAVALSLMSLAVLAMGSGLWAQADLPESFHVYTEHPRLFLGAPRLRLLRRERERQSMRWEQFHLLVEGGAPLPEVGFANALYYRVADDKAAARRAIDWVSKPDADLRQVALVYDWCQDQLSAADKQRLASALRAGLQKPGRTMSDYRAKVLAALALSGEEGESPEKALSDFLQHEWPERVVRPLREGKAAIQGGDTYALLEILHAVRDNFQVDLRSSFPAFFHQLPLYDLLSYYPAPYPANENEFHIPFSAKGGEPDLQVAALSRAGELAMVAFDTNSPESQVLQGWLMDDRFLMRGLFGNPYEFLWANPYQPGLSYYHVPLVLHDDILGRLLIRSSWDDDARWAGYIDGRLQEFKDGRVVEIDPRTLREPLDLDEAAIFYAPTSHALRAEKKDLNDVFVVGLSPRAWYHVEAEDEEMREEASDPGGILYFPGLRPNLEVRFQPEPLATAPAAAPSH